MTYFKNKDIHKIKNKDLFTECKKWCDSTNVKVEYNIIQFGIKLQQVSKKNLNKDGNTCIDKDSKHSTTTIYIQKCKDYFKSLNGTSFIDDEDLDE